MGLTIHYTISVPQSWTHGTILQKLKEAQAYAKTLPFVHVSDVKEFKGNECDFWWIRDNPTPELNEENDEFFWAKIQGSRYIHSPYKPGQSRTQCPNRMMVFSIYPARESEQMNIGICSHPRTTWKAEKEVNYLAWSIAQKGEAQSDQEKVWKTFTKKWKLRKMKESRRSSFYDHPTRKYVYEIDVGWFSALIVGGAYMSHRKGRAPDFGLVRFRDQLKGYIQLKYQGTAQEAEEAFKSKEFQDDVKALVYGKEHQIPASFGSWHSFCKTQYANDPRVGGFNNFQVAHLGVIAMLDKLIELGFKVKVSDEGNFWGNRDIGKLAEEIASWDSFIAGMGGIFKDIAPGQVETAMDGRPDFEKLEMQSYKIPNVGEHLQRLRKIMVPAPVDEVGV